MNRENKRKTFEKGYYKTHACNEVFTCRNCGRIVRASRAEYSASERFPGSMSRWQLNCFRLRL